MKLTKSHRNNIILLGIIAIMIIPQTRQPIQILLHKGLALFSPSVIDTEDRVTVTDYNWKLIDASGTSFDFNDAKGKVVLINFWATWCPPCIAEMPSMEKLYEKYQEEMIFLFVSDENNAIVSKFKTTNNYKFEVYSSVSTVPKVFETSSIPRTFILDKEGQIVVDKSGAANWNSESIHNTINSLLH